MDLTSLLVQVVAGALGGSAAGAAAQQYSLGTLGNSGSASIHTLTAVRCAGKTSAR